ncbi:hepatic leukemia factor-like [Mya arenaria]|uniref:hepatic leukemia factor-like n=1 Tax=Mya arenaria TaxID=6604 RepID=UPI0022E5313C|nr:hepatic leukemia factor-like [Mya arenaria]
MSDGTFCDFPGQMDNALAQQIQGFSARGMSENLGDGLTGSSKALAGFYMEQFAQGMPSSIMESLAQSGLAMSSMAGSHTSQEMLIANMMSQAAAAGSYENAMNFALKSEKGLPPTPPGSPDEPKSVHNTQHQSYHSNMHPASMVAMQSSFNPNLLPKPLPMRRLSDKRLSHHRDAQPQLPHESQIEGANNQTLARALASVSQTQKRPRSEKKPIPEDLKDDKYFERRKRNNNAAKKSRDSRKAREDEIAIRASFLEKENAILRAQVGTLREEANSLRQLLLQKRAAVRH